MPRQADVVCQLRSARPFMAPAAPLAHRQAYRRVPAAPIPGLDRRLAGAAVAARAQRLKIRTSRTLTRVEMTLTKPLDSESVRKALTTPDGGDEAAASHLSVGLRSVAARKGGQFVLVLPTDVGCDCLVWDGASLSVRRSENSARKLGLELEVASGLKGQWPRWTSALKAGRASEEKLTLSSLAYTCPVPIQVDGEPLPRSGADDPTCFVQPLFYGFAPKEAGGIRMPLWLLASLNRKEAGQKQRVDMYWRVSYCYRLVHRAFHKTPTPVSKAAYSVVYWILDGVVVEKQVLRDQSTPFMVSLFADASGCGTDISGFRLRRDGNYKKRFDEVKLRHLKALFEVEEQVKALSGLPGQKPVESMASTFGYMPIKGSLIYEAPGSIANRLVKPPPFRALLAEMVLREARRCAGSR